ncbi:MAG TPA: DUF882 domain-containing protein [Rhizobiaceae bacterium]|nr:DUF882 domain-containing protein [Rhizobiaceae bacterium]
MGRGGRKVLTALAVSIGVLLTSQAASAETRSLKLYFIHTKERAEIVYKKNGRYVQSGLNEINRFLRDWRRNEPAKMDPRLLDLVWSVYRATGARDYIHVVSAYRSPATNGMLRSRSSGVAEKSQHMLGKAMDFYIPGVPLSKLRQTAFKFEGGGVGYYPKSGSPFVHLDVGNVRAWPRMSRNELLALFPDGKTVHLPADGKPLAGYQQAMAAYKSRQRSGASVQMASAEESGPRRRGLLSALFGGGGADEDEDNGEARAVAQRPAPQRQQPAPQPSAPVQQAEPEQPAPETIIAQMPAREVPLPQLAPRPSIDVGAPTALAALAPVENAPSAGVAAATAVATEVALNVPLPTRRPNYTAPAVAMPDSAPVPSHSPVVLAAAEQDAPVQDTPQRDLIAELAGQQPATSPSATLAAYVPVPNARPGRDDAFALAAVMRTTPSPAVAKDPVAVEQARLDTKERTERLARLASAPSASPKAAIIARGGTNPSAVAAGAVRTTAKSSKPRSTDSEQERTSRQVPVQQEIARWALSRQPVITNTAGTKAPSFAYDIVRTAPKMVYTNGFQPNGSELEASRFTGKAVEFMSVARFTPR